jgi:protein O-GlcNAc transferase
MRRLFLSAERYVIVYSSNHEGEQPAGHVKHRRFTDWVEVYYANFKLVRHIPNRWPLVDNDQSQSFADFFIFEKLSTRRHSLPGRLVLSLTSYRKRFPTLELTLHRILQQSIQPDETILWISTEDRQHLPEGILALQRDGLTVRETRDIRSYKKIIPTLEHYPDSFIITLDDDIAYPLDTTELLVANYRSPREILCRRANRIAFDDSGNPKPYSQWLFEAPDEMGSGLVATGVGGVLYPPHSLPPDVFDEATFTVLAPLADDLWLFWMERLAGCVVRRVGPRYVPLPWPGCDEQGLWENHNANGGNDRVIAALTARYGSPFGQCIAHLSSAGGGNGSPLRALFKRFAWSEASTSRNEMTCRYEPFQPFLFMKFAAAAECNTVFDIGANIGAYSILSTRLPTVKSVHAFEVEEMAFAELIYNVLLNRLEIRSSATLLPPRIAMGLLISVWPARWRVTME